MTKDEILEKNCKEGAFELTENVIDAYTPDVYKAMDEYAKQEAIGFFNWKQSLELIEEKGSRRWLINYSMNEWSLFAENTEQLYQKYLESKKTNSNE